MNTSILPLYPTGAIGDEGSFIANFVLGLFFGFFLERAGFGSSRKLASVFYFKDWAVLRVMFTAIVVAMLGLLYVGGLGWAEADAINIGPTILGSQIVGGLLLGFGFIVGGWCPGTSVVGAASGKLDAYAYLGGLVFGSMVFGFSYDWLKPVYHWGEMGVQTLPGYFGVQPGVVAALVVLMALGAFAATELFGNRTLSRQFTLQLSPQRAGAAALAVLTFGLMTGYAMAARSASTIGHTQPGPALAAAPAAGNIDAAAAASAAASPAKLKTPAAPVKRFKKGSSCS